MIFKQFYLACLAHASYVIGDEETGTAIVVDPQRDVEQYIAFAGEHKLTIKHVFLTHFHADFLAGHLELRDRCGAEIHLGSQAEAEFAFTADGHGKTYQWGQVALEILETPGHTPEGISLLFTDRAAPDEPGKLLTGDTLFVGDVGRPDLLASIGVTAEQLANMLYKSLHEVILPLPDETVVYPAHGAGSMCGKSLGKETFTTLGKQRRFNYALQPMTPEEFREMVTADQPVAPTYFVHDAILNRKERQTLGVATRKMQVPLTLDDLRREQNAGAMLLDVREPGEFAAAHMKGAVNVPLSGKFASYAGSVVKPEESIVVIADPGAEGEAIMRLGRIGYDRVKGFLDGGMAALESAPELVEESRRRPVADLDEALDSETPPFVLDVRSAGEYSGGHIEGSTNIPLTRLRGELDAIPRDRPILVNCQSGHRSSIAASLLAGQGFAPVEDLLGGWKAVAALRGEGGESCSTTAAGGSCST